MEFADTHIAIMKEDLPALFRAADNASVAAQSKYLALIRFDLFTLILSAALTSIQVESAWWAEKLALLAAVCLALGFFATLILSRSSYRKRWYGGRAVAESVKTSAWRYMTCVEPFERGISAKEADERFSESLRDILQEKQQLSMSLGGDLGCAEQITAKMRSLRDQDLQTRLRSYTICRLADQREWYSRESEKNEKRQEWLFYSVMAVQGLALIAAIWFVTSPQIAFKPIGTLTAAAAALIAWLQVKQYQELAQSYGMAAHELGTIGAQSTHVNSEADLTELVTAAESAISREHTMWLARRDKLRLTPNN